MRLRVLGIVLAGGKGTRLYPLTKERAKPAVPFGGKYRIIDFVLSNFINSGIYSIYVLTQFKSQSLLQHLAEGWQFGALMRNQFIIPVPAQMRSAGETWYQGTADAIYQNINLVEQANPHLVAIFGGDHIYRMNVNSMVEFHAQTSADVTVAAIPVDRKYAAEFGVVETAADGQILAFHEKRADAPTIFRATASPEKPPPALPTGGMWEPSTRTTRPTWICARFPRPSTSTTGSGRCAPPATPSHPPSSPSTTRTGAARPSIPSFPGAASSPAGWCAIRCWRAACACMPAPWLRIPSSWTTAISGDGPKSAAPFWTRTCASRKMPASATTASVTRSSTTSPKAASWWWRASGRRSIFPLWSSDAAAPPPRCRFR